MASVNNESDSELSAFVHRIAAAEISIDEKDYSSALDHYFTALQLLKPFQSLKASLKTKFALAFQERCVELDSTGKYDEMFDCFRQLGETFPECEVAVNTMGTFLFRLGMIEEAACCFRQALKQDPSFLGARENLENAASHLVERWHFRMLNDQDRNAGFSNAITKAMTEGHSLVLDIGSGTGLLSMFAVLTGAESVHACEMSKSMVEMSRDVLQANRMSDEVTLYHKRSDELVIGDELPQWVDLVVTETVDGGLLGEHILETVHDAWERLLVPHEAGGRVIPAGAKVYACGIECLAVRKQNRLLYPALPQLDLDTLKLVSDVGSWDGTDPPPRPPDPDDERDVDTVSDAPETPEPYTTEDLRTITGGYKQLTGIHSIMSVNFNDRDNVASLMLGTEATFNFDVTSRGRLDALVLWFDLDLDDEHSLSTSPYQVSCWDQAVYPVLHQHLIHKGKFGENFMVRPGDSISVSMVTKSDQIRLRCTGIDRGCMDIDNITQSLASITSREKTDDQSANGDVTDEIRIDSQSKASNSNRSKNELKSRDIYALDRRHIEALNDFDYNTCYCKAIRTFCQNGSNLIVSMQGFPVLGLQALKMGASKVIMPNVSDQHKELMDRIGSLNELTRLNEAPKRKKDATSEKADDVRGYVYGGSEFDDYGREYDVIVCDVVDPCGALRQRVLEDVAIMRLTCLKPSGLVVPSLVRVQALLIQSDQLREHSRIVGDERTLGLVIAEYMNDFALDDSSVRLYAQEILSNSLKHMSIHVDIDLDTLPHTKLSTPFELLTLNLNEPLASTTTTTIPKYLQQERSFSCDVTDSGDLHAIVYWFDLDLHDGHRLSTLGAGHWKQAAVMVKHPLTIVKGETVIVDVRLKDSCFDVKVCVDDR